MPIYAYRCEACGFAKDVLQKISDAALTECPSCTKSTYKKQLTAAGFQLKGTGWYATDFRGGANAPAATPAAPAPGAEAKPAAATASGTAAASTNATPAAPASTGGTSGGTSSTT